MHQRDAVDFAAGNDVFNVGVADGASTPVGGHVIAPRIQPDLSNGIDQSLRGLLPRWGEPPNSELAYSAFDDVHKKAMVFENLHCTRYEPLMQPLPRFRSPIRHISGYLLVVGPATMKLIGTKNTFS